MTHLVLILRYAIPIKSLFSSCSNGCEGVWPNGSRNSRLLSTYSCSGHFGSFSFCKLSIFQIQLGIFLVMIIHPGDPSIKGTDLPELPTDNDISPLDTFLDLVRFAAFA